MSLKCSFPCLHACNTWFLGPTWVFIPDGMSVDSAVFAQFTVGYPALYCYCITGAARCPRNCPFFREDLGLHLIHGSLGPPECAPQMAFQRFRHCRANACDQQTDRCTRSPCYICSNRPRLAVVLKCGLIIIIPALRKTTHYWWH